jgi:hypothetical protein
MLVGIISRRDILRYALEQSADLTRYLGEVEAYAGATAN